jgi:hypothetical protein
MDAAATDGASEGTFRLIYRSRSRIPEEGRRAELGALFSLARSKNKRLQVTGALVISDEWFVQTLEGDETVVRGLLARIEVDPRHDSVEVLDARQVPGRVFARWAMARVAEDGEPDIPLIAHREGISPAAPRGDSTPEQESILEVMREAARGSHASAAGSR